MVEKKTQIAVIIIGILVGILAFVLPMTSFVKVLGALVVVIAILRKVEIGVFLVVALTPFSPSTMPLVGLVILCAISLVLKLFWDKDFKLRWGNIEVCILFFAIMLVYASVTSFAFQSSIRIMLVFGSFLLFYVILYNTITSKRALYGLIVVGAFSALLVGLYGIYQQYFGAVMEQSWIDVEMFEDLSMRVYSTWENPNVLGEYLVLWIPISFGLMWSVRQWFHKIVFAGVTGVLLLCMVFTLSRGSWLGLMLAMAVFAIMSSKILVLLGGIGVLSLPFALPAHIINRFLSIGNLQDTSTSYRVSIWQGALRMAQDYWPSGIGVGSEAFAKIYPRYALSGAAFALHAHNFYIQVLAEVGVFGVLALILVLFAFYKNIFASYWDTQDKFLSTFLIAGCAGMTGFLLNGLFDNVWYNYRMVLVFWTMIALSAVACNLAKETGADKHDKSSTCGK